MKYYRAKCDSYDFSTMRSLIKGELVTPKEREKYYSHISDKDFEEVNISKSLTFTCFGVRKQISNEMYEDAFKKCGVE